MDLKDMMRREYVAAAKLTADMASTCGAFERERWLQVAEIYRQLAHELAAQDAPAGQRNPGPASVAG